MKISCHINTDFIFIATASFLLFSTPAIPQNLVPNPGFEYYRNCPDHLATIGCPCRPSFRLFFVSDWIAPTPFLGELYHECSTPNKWIGVGVPDNYHGSQKPHLGKGYAGITLYSREIGCEECKGYLQAKLNSELIQDGIYEASLFISLADMSPFSVGEIGMLFTVDPVSADRSVSLNYVPQIKNDSSVNMRDKKNWIKISGRFTAKGGEKYITIGNFSPSVNTKVFFEEKNKHNPIAYYYIDDVSVVLISKNERDIPGADSIPGNPALTLPRLSELKTGERFILHNVYFDSDEYVLREDSYKELHELAEFLKNNQNVRIEIAGHTDNKGDPVLNKMLSEKRAEAVYSYLINKGINKERLSFAGYGSSKPIADNNTDSEKNRRVEFIIRNK